MKIALITIHHANSYGGTLQALASQAVLSKYGDVKIIDYKSKELEQTLNLIRIDRNPRSIFRAGKDFFRLLPRKRLIAKFKEFMRVNYKLTPACPDLQSLQSISSDFDCVVCGSDQIWNPNITGQLDLNYMLAFSRAKRKISFSSSAGSYSYSDEETAKVRKALSTFDSISVREEDTARKLRSMLGNQKVAHTLDPTLMLDKRQWMQGLLLTEKAPVPADQYILVYTLKKDALVRETINRIKTLLGLRVVAIDQDPFLGYKSDRHIMDASPVDYVSLFANASFVITNSFHGTAFALNFAIPFVTVLPESGLNRIKGLLDKVDLADRLVSHLSEVGSVVGKPIDFTSSHKKLDALRLVTWDYLDGAFSINTVKKPVKTS
ncbi:MULTISPECIES: polysaccharide pyruvyl transferase family protein [unclassified Pseudomonas]|uniref:polysaccharide pyruvyl transferase family protein n=1 Tax=unclassified Pseudomonas TaxID=196821 RepID=UPI001913E8D1|nr:MULTISPECIES: polysaccharide pyruvyl transferase family protein [unclassified Pseudomonas]MBK5553034.1 polysaccharide pyruvyl transferase family protein [Pseudomonas sp. TH03]MEB0225207.1 polysaccharide pyruvyl transferase family protein [Pseudomonas sp. 5S1]MEB0298351.1 polysaccharide pyruvyl transferase family protein [Pseudomonas sp. 10S4]WPX17002.1 polysaccharide pyruvyl transferase family protein [Pseudomonas sp. 10S4]